MSSFEKLKCKGSDVETAIKIIFKSVEYGDMKIIKAEIVNSLKIPKIHCGDRTGSRNTISEVLVLQNKGDTIPNTISSSSNKDACMSLIHPAPSMCEKVNTKPEDIMPCFHKRGGWCTAHKYKLDKTGSLRSNSRLV